MKVLGLLLELRQVAMSIRFVSDVGSTSGSRSPSSASSPTQDGAEHASVECAMRCHDTPNGIVGESKAKASEGFTETPALEVWEKQGV